MNNLKMIAILMIALPCMMHASINGDDDNNSDSSEQTEADHTSIFDWKYEVEIKNNNNASSCSSNEKPQHIEVDPNIIFEKEKKRILHSIVIELVHASNLGRTASITHPLSQIKTMQEIQINEEMLKIYRNNESSAEQDDKASQTSELSNHKRKRSSSSED
ncbi:MAG: hypothetical protein Q8Q60_02920 [Candidatus Chromulinivorax sp.]|nr:hypothetical protein [Candidatus Chromulinivorax sp.]